MLLHIFEAAPGALGGLGLSRVRVVVLILLVAALFRTVAFPDLRLVRARPLVRLNLFFLN